MVSRRKFLGKVSTAAALGAGGLYGLLDVFAERAGAAPPPPPPSPGPPPLGGPPRLGRGPGQRPPRDGFGTPSAVGGEQYLFAPRTIVDSNVVVVSPPLHHAVVTAKLNGSVSASAQSALESVLVGLERDGLLDFTATGGGVTVAWGNSYFARLPATLLSRYLPVDRFASTTKGATVPALLDAIAFASDPSSLILESNDLAVVVSSDSLSNVNTIISTIFNSTIAELFEVTSIRRGFVDGVRLGGSGQSLTKQMALAAGIDGALSIPDQAELFLGFTSTQASALAPSNVSNLETLPGRTDQWPSGYFARGTTMHLSHITEDLVSWYASSYQRRVAAAFSATTPAGTGQPVTVVPVQPETEQGVRSEYASTGQIGHSSAMQPISRLAQPERDNYGIFWRAGTAIATRADFNTLDNPFSYSSAPGIDRMSSTPAAGVHFVAFMPTSDMFHRMRQAMDGQYGDGAIAAAAVHGPFNRVLSTTHRQNFLVPPKSHRSFPLAELL